MGGAYATPRDQEEPNRGATPAAPIEPQLDASAETMEEVGPEDLVGIEWSVRPSIVYCSELLLVADTHKSEVWIAQRKLLEQTA